MTTRPRRRKVPAHPEPEPPAPPALDDRWMVIHWMSKNVRTIAPADPLMDAYELMRIHRFRHLPVVKDGTLVGIVSDRDVRHAIPLRSREALDTIYDGKLLDTPVENVMTPNPITLDPAGSIRQAAEIMCREKIGALPIVSDGKLIGIVSAEDLLWAFVENTADLEK
jgi:acetoin utilization protein AcuB